MHICKEGFGIQTLLCRYGDSGVKTAPQRKGRPGGQPALYKESGVYHWAGRDGFEKAPATQCDKGTYCDGTPYAPLADKATVCGADDVVMQCAQGVLVKTAKSCAGEPHSCAASAKQRLLAAQVRDADTPTPVAVVDGAAAAKERDAAVAKVLDKINE